MSGRGADVFHSFPLPLQTKLQEDILMQRYAAQCFSLIFSDLTVCIPYIHILNTYIDVTWGVGWPFGAEESNGRQNEYFN